MSPEQLHSAGTHRLVDGIRQKPMFDITGATIAVIGLDPDGFLLARSSASRGFETIAFDADEVKVAQLEASDPEVARNLAITSDPSRLRQADVFVICTAPVLQGGTPDFAELKDAVLLVGSYAREGVLIIVESIVFPGVCEHVLLPLLENASGLSRPTPDTVRGGFFFAHSPAPHTIQAPRAIGASNPESLARAVALYRLFPNEVVPLRSIKEAEAVRMIRDSIHDADLAMISEFSILFDRVGIDMVHVLRAIQQDRQDLSSLSGISNSRSPASAYYVARSGHEHEIDRPFLTTAKRTIDHMPAYAVSLLFDALSEEKIPLNKSVIALLVISGQDGDPSGESIGSKIRAVLTKKGADVRVYDPYIAGAGSDLKKTLEGAEAAVVASDHPILRNLLPRQFEELGVLVVIDARNCLDKDAFERSLVRYRGIGRG